MKLIQLSAQQVLQMKSATLMNPETTARQCHFLKSPKPGKSWSQAISSKTQEKYVVNMADCIDQCMKHTSTGKQIPGFVADNGTYSLTTDFEFNILSGVIVPTGKVEVETTPATEEQAPHASSSSKSKKKGANA